MSIKRRTAAGPVVASTHGLVQPSDQRFGANRERPRACRGGAPIFRGGFRPDIPEIGNSLKTLAYRTEFYEVETLAAADGRSDSGPVSRILQAVIPPFTGETATAKAIGNRNGR
jgi:hypothetical protein